MDKETPGETDTLAALPPEQLDAFIDTLLENPDPESVPPDRLLSAIYFWEGSHIESFKKILPVLPKQLVRAKGLLTQGETVYLFNLVMGQKNIAEYRAKKDIRPLLNRVVFIGSPEAIAQLDSLSRDFPDLVKKSVFDPMAKK
jgi:hypothetical protein